MIERHFVWPGMVKECYEHCRKCLTCQVKSKHVPKRAPVVERPVLSELFEHVAFDIVDPLPKGKGGNMYLLTYICMATKWPEAIPLRTITAKSVAEGLWNIISRTSIPEKLLTDQGSQFCSRLVRELCELLQIEKIRTSPYHPQTNGAIERMHGTFKGILGKCIESKHDWVAQVPYVLFVLRQMPHADSGFSPFDLVYGFRVRTPLEAMYYGIFESDNMKTDVCEWVSGVAERLQLLRDCAALNQAKAKVSRLAIMNRGAKLREFVVGSKVLYRIPGLSCKLSDSWEWPYIVDSRLGEVNYKIFKEGKQKHAKVVHVNCLKRYWESGSICRLDVVVEGECEKRSMLSGVCEGFNQEVLDALLEEYKVVFTDKPGNTQKVVMSIDTGNNPPFRQAPYSVPIGIRDQVKKEITSLEEDGIIERCDGPWASPLVPVRKPDGSVRLCVDYRRLNSITLKEPYYIPGMDEMMDKVGRCGVLSKVDLAKGFHQVGVAVVDRDKTAFICPFGKYRYRRMPFGLANAPSVFQRLMDCVLCDCTDFSCVYIDDILIISKCWEEHVDHLRAVFEVLREAGLTCKRSKCEFGKVRLEFLGHIVGDGVVSIPEARVKALKEHPRPKTRRQLRAFLGMLNYYRRFVPDFHKWSSLLTPSTSGSAPGVVDWSVQMVEAFDTLKDKLCSQTFLCIPCHSDHFVLETDASSTGVGAVLSVLREGVLRPTAYFSRQLHGAQTRYSAQELEGLGLYEAIKHFAFFLYGLRFSVVTDHKSLVTLKTAPQHNKRLLNWALKLTEFDFEISYRNGSDNVVADCLSRCHSVEDAADDRHQQVGRGGDVGRRPT